MDFVRVYNEALPLLLAGIKMTVLISLIALAIGMVLGLVSCLLSISKNVILRFISGVYIWIIRGTPMIVQAFIIYFGMPQLIQKLFNPAFRLDPFTAGVITLSLNAGAYLSEIFRGGIQAVNKGLCAFPGNILLASHDHELLETTCNRVIEFLPDGKILDYTGTYDEYLDWKRARSAAQ